jgi:hypothetical protein
MASNVYTLALNWNSAGQFCSNILHYVFDDSGYASTAQAANALQNRWDAAAKAAWLAMLPDQVSLLSTKARKATGVGGFESVTVYAAGTVGTRSGGISASGIAPVIIHYPLNRIKGRGKVFLPGVRESDVSAGVFTNAFVAAVEAQIPTAFADLTLVGGGAPLAELVVKQKSGTPGWWAVAESQLSDIVGQQRRRQRPS